MLTLSTTTETPSTSKTWSSSFGLSKASAYWKPEPPPRTATRRAWLSPSSWPDRRVLIFSVATPVRLIAELVVSVIDLMISACVLGSSAAVPPVQILVDSARVVDHLAAVDKDRHPSLARQLLDLGPVGPPVGHPDGPVLDTVMPQPPGHGAARAEEVGRRPAAVEDDLLGGAHPSPTRSPAWRKRPKARIARSDRGALPSRSPSRSICHRTASSSVSSWGRGLKPSSRLAFVQR